MNAKKDKKKKKSPWVRPRHRVFRALLSVTLGPYIRLRYGVKVEKYRGKGPCLVLFNHQTPSDQFFVGMSFRDPVYYLATEDIFSMGPVSSVIRYLVAPIPIKKQTTDVRAVLNCIKVAGEGGTIAIAPEGNRTYSGHTEYMAPAIAPLARRLGLPILLYRIEGGYGAQPRWSDVIRRGPMRCYVSEVIPPEAYADMTDDELMERIRAGLWVDESTPDGPYRHKRRAEYLERAMYVCPRHGLSEFHSRGDTVTCKTCGLALRYTENKTLEAVGDADFPFTSVSAWYDYQKDFINALDITPYTDTPLYRDTATLSEVIPYKKKKTLVKAAAVTLYGDRMVLEGGEEPLILPFEEVTAASVLGRNKLNLYHGKKVYQLKGGKRFNALKYLHLYHHFQNLRNGDRHEQFLGL